MARRGTRGGSLKAKKGEEFRGVFASANKFTGDQIKTIAQNVYLSLTLPAPVGTPVKSGFHLSSWRYTVNHVKTDVAPYTKEDRKTANRTQTIFPGIPADFDTIVTMKDKVFVTNHAVAIGKLNEGYSPQQEPGFIQRVVKREVQRGAATAAAVKVSGGKTI